MLLAFLHQTQFNGFVGPLSPSFLYPFFGHDGLRHTSLRHAALVRTLSATIWISSTEEVSTLLLYRVKKKKNYKIRLNITFYAWSFFFFFPSIRPLSGETRAIRPERNKGIIPTRLFFKHIFFFSFHEIIIQRVVQAETGSRRRVPSTCARYLYGRIKENNIYRVIKRVYACRNT